MQEQQNNLLSELSIDDGAKKNIAGIATWAMIGVVAGLLSSLFSIITFFVKGDENAAALKGSSGIAATIQSSFGGGGALVVQILIGLVSLYFLYRFIVLARKSLLSHSQTELTEAFRNLKIYFTIYTIILIVACLVILIAVGYIFSSGANALNF